MIFYYLLIMQKYSCQTICVQIKNWLGRKFLLTAWIIKFVCRIALAIKNDLKMKLFVRFDKNLGHRRL